MAIKLGTSCRSVPAVAVVLSPVQAMTGAIGATSMAAVVVGPSGMSDGLYAGERD